MSLESRRRASAKYYAENRDLCIARTGVVNKRRKAERQDFVRNYLELNPCVDCGESDYRVLEFDHRDPADKDVHVAILIGGYSMKRLIAEIEKCDVRCCNCHRRKTGEQFGWWRAVADFEK